MAMSSTSATAVKFSVEVITLPVSDVDRALRFYVDRVGFTLDVDYSPNEAFRVVQLTPPGSAARFRSARGLTDAPAGFASQHLSRRNRPCGGAEPFASNVGSKSAKSGTRRPLMPGTGVSNPGSTLRTGITPASPTSRIRMATAGCYRNEVIGMFDLRGNISKILAMACCDTTPAGFRRFGS